MLPDIPAITRFDAALATTALTRRHSPDLEMSERFGGLELIMRVHLFFVVGFQILVTFQCRGLLDCRSGERNVDTGMAFIHAHAFDRNQASSFGILLRHAKHDGFSFEGMPVADKFSYGFAGSVHDFFTQKIFYFQCYTHSHCSHEPRAEQGGYLPDGPTTWNETN